MKQLIAVMLSGLLGSLLMVGAVFANTDVKNRLPTDYEVKAPASIMEPTIIDSVPVPYEVLVYAQVVYQGYAVTQAQETTWNGQKAYQLRIDNDSNPYDANGMYLLYDSNWKLIDNKPLNAPIPKERKSGVDRVKKVPNEAQAEDAPNEENDGGVTVQTPQEQQNESDTNDTLEQNSDSLDQENNTEENSTNSSVETIDEENEETSTKPQNEDDDKVSWSE